MQNTNAGTKTGTSIHFWDSSPIENGCEIVRFFWPRLYTTRESRGPDRVLSKSGGNCVSKGA